jgi:hypothetical protein
MVHKVVHIMIVVDRAYPSHYPTCYIFVHKAYSYPESGTMDSITISLFRLVGNMFGFSEPEQDNPWSYARVLAERLRPEPPKPRRYVQASEVVYPGTTDGKLELAVNEMTVCKEIFDKWGASMDEYASSSS